MTPPPGPLSLVGPGGAGDAADQEPPVVVVGAGIAGVSCARVLHDAGVPVRVLDRGRRLGGRMAVRTEQVNGADHAVDVGAQYLTAHDPDFVALVEEWERDGLVRLWTDTFHLAGPEGLAGTSTGPVRWAGTDGLRALVEHLAVGLEVEHPVDVAEVAVGPDGPRVDGEPAAFVVLAMPDPQALDLLPEELGEALGLRPHVAWSPTVAVWAGWLERWWPELDGVFVQGSPVLRWIADDGRRRGDDAPILVAHTEAVLAAGMLDRPGEAASPVLAELGRILGADLAGEVPEPLWIRAQRWSLSAPIQPHPEPFGLDLAARVGVCSDAWGPRSRVEQAWLSGRALGRALVDRALPDPAGSPDA
jgi:renalase